MSRPSNVHRLALLLIAGSAFFTTLMTVGCNDATGPTVVEEIDTMFWQQGGGIKPRFTTPLGENPRFTLTGAWLETSDVIRLHLDQMPWPVAEKRGDTVFISYIISSYFPPDTTATAYYTLESRLGGFSKMDSIYVTLKATPSAIPCQGEGSCRDGGQDTTFLVVKKR